jgi:hypothetical protein
MAIFKTIKFKNGATVHFDDEFMTKGVNKIETPLYTIYKDESKEEESENENILEIINYK